jgi:hypothetical protein
VGSPAIFYYFFFDSDTMEQVINGQEGLSDQPQSGKVNDYGRCRRIVRGTPEMGGRGKQARNWGTIRGLQQNNAIDIPGR